MKETVCFHVCVPSQVWVNVLIIANSCRPTFRKQALCACTGSYVCVRRRGDRGHWRIMSDGGIAGCCVPPVTRLICLGGGCTCEASRAPPPAEGSHGNGCQMKPPGLAHLLPATLCFSVIIVTGLWWSGAKPHTPEEVFISYVWGQHASCNKSQIGNVYRNCLAMSNISNHYTAVITCLFTALKLNIICIFILTLCKNAATSGITIKWVKGFKKNVRTSSSFIILEIK